MISELKRLRDDESGTTAIEYALIATLVSTALIVGLTAYASSASDLWNFIATTILASM